MRKFLAIILCLISISSILNGQVEERIKLHELGIEYSNSSYLLRIQNNDKVAVKLFWESGMPIDAGNAVSMVIESGNTSMFEYMLQNGLSTRKGFSVSLDYRYNQDIYKLLLQYGFNLSEEIYPDSYCSYPIFKAIEMFNYSLVVFLINNGVDVNIVCSKNGIETSVISITENLIEDVKVAEETNEYSIGLVFSPYASKSLDNLNRIYDFLLSID